MTASGILDVTVEAAKSVATFITVTASPTSLGAGGGALTVKGQTDLPDGAVVFVYVGSQEEDALVGGGVFEIQFDVPENTTGAPVNLPVEATGGGLTSNSVTVVQAAPSEELQVSASGFRNALAGQACEIYANGVVNHGELVDAELSVSVAEGTPPYSWTMDLDNGLQPTGSGPTSTFAVKAPYCTAIYGEATGGTIYVTDSAGKSGSSKF